MEFTMEPESFPAAVHQEREQLLVRKMKAYCHEPFKYISVSNTYDERGDSDLVQLLEKVINLFCKTREMGNNAKN